MEKEVAASKIQSFWLSRRTKPTEPERYCEECADDVFSYNEFCNKYLCTDCFWDFEEELKRKRRADPEWRFQRAYSAAKVILGKSDEEALQIAKEAIFNSSLSSLYY